MRPKDLRLIPDELFIQEKCEGVLEWSTLRGGLRNGCAIAAITIRYINATDVCISAFSMRLLWITIGRLTDAKIWLGLVCYGRSMTWLITRVSFRPPILEDTSQCERSHWWLLGGVSGTEYLVSSRGLIQPRARSGIIAPGIHLWSTGAWYHYNPHPL